MKLVMEDGWWWRWRRIALSGATNGFHISPPEEEQGLAAAPYRKTWWIILFDFFSPRTWIYGVGVEVGGGPGGPRGRRRTQGVGRAPTLMARVLAPFSWFFRQCFLLIPKGVSVKFLVIPRTFISDKNNTMAILLKTASFWVSSIQIMQIRVQNKGKRVWKSRYDGDISTPPSLTHCLSSSNSVDKLKVMKKNFYKLYLSLLLQICKANIQVFSKDYELTIFTITFRSHVYSYQWHNQLASNNNKSWMTTVSQNNDDMI